MPPAARRPELAIPPELDGRYLRNGANPITGYADHPFLGDGMVHGIRLRDGRIERDGPPD